MKPILKVLHKLIYPAALLLIMTCMGFIALYLAVGPELPEVASIQEIRLQTPMRVYAKDNQLMAEFGSKRRIPITLDQVPKDFINALLSTEDKRFYHHSGVDFLGIARAIVNLVKTGTKGEGGSTITMQVARNYYLTREKRFTRKITEIFLAWKIESELNKDEILQLYLNKIHFGHRAYGLGAAAQVYYGAELNTLSLSKLAILAGIPKGESKYNPISSPKNASERRAHVLNRMLSENHITRQTYHEAISESVETTKHGARESFDAPYFSEMVRRKIIKLYGVESAYNDGLQIYTTLDPKLQTYAQQAMIEGLEEYDFRHGYRGPENNFPIDENTNQEQITQWLKNIQKIGELQPGIVLKVDDEQGFASVQLKQNKIVSLLLEDVEWARKYIDENHRGPSITTISQVLSPGDLIRLKLKPTKLKTVDNNSTDKDISNNNSDQSEIYQLSQIPDISGGFVSIVPDNGAIESLVGGYNFSLNQYNGVTQANRQLGSNIKPFIYSAAFEKPVASGKQFTPASIINDMPIVERDITAENFWRPKNDGDNYRGPTRLRNGLRYSKNTISIRLIKDIGAKHARNYLEKIGFPKKRMQAYHSLALGAASFTPLEVVTTYAVLANGGYKIEPWFIQRVEKNERIIYQHQPIQVCRECEKTIEQELAAMAISKEANSSEALSKSTQIAKSQVTESEITESGFYNLPKLPVEKEKIALRVIEERNRYLIDDILKDVIHKGTARGTLTRSKSPLLKRNDLAGKTGTTNGPKDAWFSGYNINHVATTWVGFNDHAKELGDKEFGGKAALPIWQKFFEKALAGTPQINHPEPPGIITVRIDPKTGLLANSLTEHPIFEIFRTENAPTTYSEKPIGDIFNQDSEIVDDEIIF